MESTGVYWVPVYEILEEHGLAVVLANARDCKAVPGRKSDVNDAQWLQRLHACGLLRPSFHPARDIAALRAYMRIRDRHLEYAAAHMQHMQKALTLMNLQLHHVLSDISGVTGLKIIRAIVAGERDPDVLASMRDVRCRESMDTIRAALVGNYQPEHVFALSQALALFDAYQDRIADCDQQIENSLRQLNADRPEPEAKLPAPRTRTKQANAPSTMLKNTESALKMPKSTILVCLTGSSAKLYCKCCKWCLIYSPAVCSLAIKELQTQTLVFKTVCADPGLRSRATKSANQ